MKFIITKTELQEKLNIPIDCEIVIENETTESAMEIPSAMESMTTKLSADLKSAWSFSAECVPSITKPSDIDWTKQIELSKTQKAVPGSYTLNPETLGLNFDTINPVVINKPEWVGKPRGEVFSEVIRDYEKTHYIPGWDYIQWLNEHPDKHHDFFDKTNYFYAPASVYFYAPASVFGRYDGSVIVPCARWDGDVWSRCGYFVEVVWDVDDRVLLLPR